MKRKKSSLTTGVALLTCLMAGSASAAVTPYSWIRAGEAGLMADSSGSNHPFNAAFSSGCQDGAGGGGLTAAVISAVAAGGPLGGTSTTSTFSTRWGSFSCGNSGMWIQGPNNTVPPASQWSLPATNWVMECWVLPVGTGRSGNGQTSQFMSTGTGHFGGTPRGAAFRTTYNAETETVIISAHAIGPTPESNFQIGEPVVSDKTRWIHVAVVNDNGVSTFYVNGVPSGEGAAYDQGPITGTVPYIGSGQDTGNPFNGYLDELRYSTFAPGAFQPSDLLVLPAGPGFIKQPESMTVWNGGPAPFEVITTLSPDNSFQWKRDGVDLPGETLSEYYIPAVTAADSGKVYSVAVSDGTVTTTTPDATLTVVPNQTENNEFFRSAIQAESSLIAFFPVDGDGGANLTNVKNAGAGAELKGTASFDGRSNRSYGQRALRLKGDGDAMLAANTGFEFTDGTGTIEALVYLDSPVTQNQKTLFSVAANPATVYYAFEASPDGTALVYRNDAAVTASWSVSPSLLGRLAHVAFVFTAGKVTAYVDGVSLGTKDHASFGTTSGLQANIGSLGVNNEGLPANAWNGSIDEIAIYSDALSESAIAVHNSRFIYGTAVTAPTIQASPSGTRNLLAGGAPVFRVNASGTAPLSYQWKLNGNPILDNPSAATASFTVMNSTVASSGEYTVTVSNPQGSITSDPFTVNFAAPPADDKYASFVLADHPVSYWRLNETAGTVLKDYAGGHDGVYASTVGLGVPGQDTIPDLAATFSGSASPVANAVVPYTPNHNPTGPFSVEFWAKPNVSGNIARAVIGTQNRNTGRAGWAVYQGFNVNGWEAHIGFAETVLFIQGSTAPTAGRWDHVVVTWDGNNIARIYVNGVDDTASATVNGPHRNNLSQPLEIGSRFNGSVPYNGTIDEVAFYQSTLTPDQIRQHWSASWVNPVITQQPPETLNAVEASTITIAATVTGYPNTYRWLKDGVAIEAATNPDGTAHYPQGFTSPTLVIAQGTLEDSGTYQLEITHPLLNLTTVNVALTVAADLTSPTIRYVTADASASRVRVAFDRWVSPDSASVPANYVFDKGVTATGVALTTDPAVLDVITTGLAPNTSYTLSISGVKDQRVSQNLIQPNSTTFKSYVLTSGTLALDFYAKIPGTSVDSLRNDAQFPNGVYTNLVLTNFSTLALTAGDWNSNPAFGPRNLGSDYGVRVYGWITPPKSGNYTFFLRSDDASELLLSGDESTATTQIAFESACCEGFKEPAEGVTETSAPQALVAGQKYFIEVLNKEGGGGDFVEVAWREESDTTPAGSLKPIPAEFLSSLAPAPQARFNAPVLAGGQIVISWVGTGVLQESTDLTTWTAVAGNPASPYQAATPGTRKFYRIQE
jgi:hypothetical protein